MPKLKKQVKTIIRVSERTLTSSSQETESSSHGREQHITDTSLVGFPCDDQSRREQLPRKSDEKVTSHFIKVPVVSSTGTPLMPCHSARARELVKKGKAIGRFSNSIYYIKLLFRSEGNVQTISCGIDPGSKREAITVKTKNHTLINILAKARDGIKESLESRKNMRRARRFRKTPCRKNKYNRNIHKSRLPPSTRTRWNSKLRIINILKKLYPIEVYIFEDISAKTLKGKRNWNKNFSPLQVGKDYFIAELEKLGKIIIKQGFETAELRNKLGLEKSKKKLDKIFSAHNVDSWVLANSIFNIQLIPENTSLYYFEHIEVHRRQLHMLQFAKGGIRKRYGGTVSLGIPKGSVVKILYKKKPIFSYIGGNANGKYSIHSLVNGKRLTQNIKIQDIEIYPGWIAKWKVERINDQIQKTR